MKLSRLGRCYCSLFSAGDTDKSTCC